MFAGYSEASDGWWAHSGGEWLHNKKEMAYFHLPTGEIRVMEETPEQAPSNGKEGEDGPLLRGKVRWFNEKKGFGFIEPLDDAASVIDKDLFVHRNQIQGAERREKSLMRAGEGDALCLEAEQLVTFRLGQTEDGRMCAVAVNVAEAEEKEEEEEKEEGSEASSVEIDLEEELKPLGSKLILGSYSILCVYYILYIYMYVLYFCLEVWLLPGQGRRLGVKKICSKILEGKEAIEDYVVDKLKLPINALGETATCVFFGVFDGHGGPYCAEHVA